MVTINSNEVMRHLDDVLVDDNTSTGGTAYEGERLGDFIWSALQDTVIISLEQVNKALTECGISPIRV